MCSTSELICPMLRHMNEFPNTDYQLMYVMLYSGEAQDDARGRVNKYVETKGVDNDHISTLKEDTVEQTPTLDRC